MINKFLKGEFQRYFLKMFSGTLMAQIIGILASFILTRLYTPEAYGTYGVYLSVLSIILVISTLRYEYSLSIVKDSELLNIKRIITISSIVIVNVTLIFILGSYLLDFRYYKFSLVILFIISLFLSSQNQFYQYILNRKKDFDLLSKTKIIQVLATSVLSIILAFIFPDYGLVIANTLGIIFLYLIFIRYNKRNTRDEKSTEKLTKTFKKYKEYALYNTPSALCDVLSLQAPILFLQKFFSVTEVGFYSLTMRTILLPLNLISVSLSQVFLSKISEKFRNNEPFHYVTKRLMIILAVVSFIPSGVLYFFSEDLFQIFFGSKWIVSGTIASIMSFAMYFRFIASPISMIFYITNSLRILFGLQVVRVITTCTILYLGSNTHSLILFIKWYSIHEMIFYVIYLALIYYVSWKKGR